MDKQKIYCIIHSFADELVPSRYRETVARWLVGRSDEEQKDEVLKQIWQETDGSSTDSLQLSLTCFRNNRNKYEKNVSRSIGIRRMFRYAAILLLPLITGITVWWGSSTYYAKANEMIECYVPNGQIKTILLSDGTSIIINSGTTLLYPKKFEG